MVDFSKMQPPNDKTSKANPVSQDASDSRLASSGSKTEQIQTARKELWNAGLAVRREVLGSAHVDRSLSAAGSSRLSELGFLQSAQELATEVGWGIIWTRPGLSLKTRSFMNLAMLLALGKSNELGVHVRGAVRNGLTIEEIREALLHASVYAGLPAGLEGFRAAEKVLSEMVEKGELTVKAKL